LVAAGEGGVKVASVLSGGPADKAGLRAGDRVKSMGDKRIASVAEAGTALATMAEGAKLALTIDRDGQEREIVVELGRGL
jgi:S1-C subfamily serine protease